MNNKFLIILWVIIISGSIFAGYNYFNNQNIKITGNQTQQSQTETQKTNQSKPSEETTLINKSFKDLITEGDKFYKEEDLKNAIKYYKSATRAFPEKIEGYLKLIDAYLKNNQNTEAKKESIFLTEKFTTSIEAQIFLIKSQIALKDIENAKKTLDALNQEDFNVIYYKGILDILFKNFDTAFESFGKIINSKDENKAPEDLIKKAEKFIAPKVLFSTYKEGNELFFQTLLAKSLSDAEEGPAAIPLLYDVINQQNNYRDAWIILGYCYLKTNKIQDSIDALSQAEALSSEHPQTLFLLGLAYFANNDIDKAIYYLQEADKNGYEPKEELNLKLGDLYIIKKKYEKASMKYEEVISQNKSNINIFVKDVYLNIDKLNKPGQALKISQEALSAHPNNPMSYNLLGWSYTALGKFDEAKTYLDKAIELYPNFDAAHLNMGIFYEKQNKLDLAKEFYKKAYNLGKNNSIATLAAERYKNLDNQSKNNYYQTNISSPNSLNN
ncbi:MAG: tetratricopeptide repeat protein [Candidatus Gracilibacteria bacterium]